LPQWPQGDGWLRACSLPEYAEHYSASRDIGERLALARALPIAGDADLGSRFIAASQPFVYRESGDAAVFPSGDSARPAQRIETVTAAFQVAHGMRHPVLRRGGTLAILDAVAAASLVPEPLCRELDHAYIFLRTAEHRRQLGWADADLDAQVEASRSRVEEICATIVRLQG